MYKIISSKNYCLIINKQTLNKKFCIIFRNNKSISNNKTLLFSLFYLTIKGHYCFYIYLQFEIFHALLERYRFSYLRINFATYTKNIIFLSFEVHYLFLNLKMNMFKNNLNSAKRV